MTPEHQMIPQRVHLVGIGGAGMSGLAQCLLRLKREVSGSDLQRSAETNFLSSIGAHISYQHAAENVGQAELVVASDAIPANNLELAEARRRNIWVLRRAECLDFLCRTRNSVLVAGSHGKSTVSAMIAKVLDSIGASPSYLLGASSPSLSDQRGCIGTGAHFVAEACEAFQNLYFFHPDVAVITNIDDDHLDHYGSQEKLDKAFRSFANRVPSGGAVIAGGDDEGVRRILTALDVPVATFGFGAANDVCAGRHEINATHSIFQVRIEGRDVGTFRIQIPGRHAILNALACIGTCRKLGIPIDDIANGLGAFTGVSGRWQDHGLIAGVRVIQDYAHHPTALRAVIATARSATFKYRRVVIAFQPQLYSRTQRLYREFAAALSGSNLVLLAEIDAAGERDNGTRSRLIRDELEKLNTDVVCFGDMDDFVEHAPEHINPGDLLLITGAGDIRKAAERLSRRLSTRSGLTFTPPHQRVNYPLFYPLFRAIGRVESALKRRRSRLGFAFPLFRAIRRLFRAIGRLGSALKRQRSRLGFALKRQRSVVSRFQLHATRSPYWCAVSERNREMSYRELDQTSDALAAIFNARRIAYGTVIGVRLVPSIDLIVVMLGLMKIGATYLPLDINLPIERIAFMLSASGSKLIITSSEMTSGMGIAGVESLLLEELQVELENLQKISTRPVGPSPEDSAYICFTSGSTGFPKGVRITHDSLLSLMSDITVRFGIGPYTKMALNTSISFDVSIAEIWMTLCAGGTLFVAGSAKSLVGERLANFIDENGVTHIAITPSVLASVRQNILPTLECIICAGEPCPSELIEKWAPGRRFINAYGPTEATIYATASECRPGEPVTIGKALAHTRTYVLDSELNHLPPGQIGELYLGGVAVAKGYIGLEEESREKFVILRQASKQFDRIYKTGDLVKIDGNGNLVFIGRLDNQIKILGNRIELEEIECSIKRFEGIVDAAVCVDDSAGSKELVCFAVLDATQSADWAVISERLAAWLPSYMLPSRFVRVQSIPLTPSGKKDRRALITRHRVRYSSGTEYQPPRNDIEAKLISIWKGILKIDLAIGVYDAFTSLGGDSLQKLLLIDEVEQKFDIRVPPGYFGPITTIAQLAVQIANLLRTANPQGAPRAGSDFRASRIYKQLRDITAGWTGARAHDGDLIVSYGGDSATYDLFFFVQQESQLHSLFKYIGDDFRLHGMRSGVLVMNYRRDNVERICSYYIEELNRISPRGKLVIGGLCEGAGLAHTMASMLQNAGGRVSLLVLMEQARLLPFNGHTAFFYAKDSYLNPFNRYDSGTARYDNVYGAGYSLDILPGNHGTLFDEPIVQLLAKKVRARVADVL